MVKPFYKPLDRPERDEIWYCYSIPNREKQDSKTLPKVPISQVPDLTNETVKEDSALQKNINVGRVLETDSKYVKLAKTGGRKNLLCYLENEPKNTGPKAYHVPEWYHHGDGKGEEEQVLSEEEKRKKYKVTYGKRSYKTLEKSKTYERPDYMTHLDPEERKDAFGVSDRIPDRPIFGYDSFSYWKRDELEKSNKLPCLVPENKLQPSKRKEAHAEGSIQSKAEVRAKKKLIKLSKQSTKEIVPGYRKIDDRFGYITKWHDKWYAQAVKS